MSTRSPEARETSRSAHVRGVRRASARVAVPLVAAFAALVMVAAAASAAVARPRFAPPAAFDGVANPTLTRAGDVDGDGLPDLVSGGTDLIGGAIVSVVIVQLNTGGAFGPTSEIVVRTETAGNGLDTIRLADVNRDKRLDVEGGFQNTFPAPSNLFVMLGNGDGTFQAPALLSNGDPTERTVKSLAVADVTSDRRPDIVTAYGNSSPNQVSVLPGNGDGTFGQAILSGDTGIDWKAGMAIADVTGDRIPDVVVANTPLDPNFGSTTLMVEQGHGDGTFTLAQSLAIDGNAFDDVVVTDFDRDRHLDVAVTGSAGTDGGLGGLYVALGTGSPLGTPTRYDRPWFGLAVGDYNLDGRPDIATGQSSAAPYLWISMNVKGSFARAVTFTGTGPVAAAADFTGDGKADIVSENFSPTEPAALLVNITP